MPRAMPRAMPYLAADPQRHYSVRCDALTSLWLPRGSPRPTSLPTPDGNGEGVVIPPWVFRGRGKVSVGANSTIPFHGGPTPHDH